MISISGLAKSFGERRLFASFTAELQRGERYGLVGANGSGKTTLLNIIGGLQEPSAGSVSMPAGTRLGVLRQDQFIYEDEEVLGVALRGNPELWRAMVEKAEVLEGATEDFDVDRFAALEEAIQRHDGYAAEARAAKILEGLGLPAEVHRQPMSTLSGGFKLRVLLAQALAGTPDALLLDEPTNHLDILSIRWLEKFIRDFAGPVVVISHDHRFLDNVSTHILDVDYETVTLYPGTYTDFLVAKREERERREKEIANREREIAHHQKFVDRFRAKASKARQAQSKLRLIEKKAESLEELPGSSRRYPHFRFEERRHSGRQVLAVRGVRKAFGERDVLHGVDLEVERGDRLAIMGPNGIGKSTLLKILVGELAADAGDVTWGHETYSGYFAQDHHEQFENPDLAAEDWITGFCPGKTYGFVRGEMGRVLFSGDDGRKKLGSLSGGEAARLVFCKLAIERPNVLVLDEPTNHLDLESIEALVEALDRYEGTLLFVSHDRWFVSRLADRIVEITPDGMSDYRGSYEDYVHFCGDDHLDVDTVVLRARSEKRSRKGGPESKAANRSKGGSEGAKRELERERDAVTAEIESAEARTAEIEREFADPGFYDRASTDEQRRLQSELESLRSRIEGLLSDWERVEGELDGAGPPA